MKIIDLNTGKIIKEYPGPDGWVFFTQKSWAEYVKTCDALREKERKILYGKK